MKFIVKNTETGTIFFPEDMGKGRYFMISAQGALFMINESGGIEAAPKNYVYEELSSSTEKENQ